MPSVCLHDRGVLHLLPVPQEQSSTLSTLASEVAQQRDVVARKKISREKLRASTEK